MIPTTGNNAGFIQYDPSVQTGTLPNNGNTNTGFTGNGANVTFDPFYGYVTN